MSVTYKKSQAIVSGEVFTAIEAGFDGGGEAKNAVLYVPQDLTPAEKKQARTNIGVNLPGGYLNIKKIEEYAYETTYEYLNYEYAEARIANMIPSYGACSSISKGNFLARNFDLKYNNKVTFVVHTTGLPGRYATTCLSGHVGNLTNTFVQSGVYSDDYLMVPFMAVDGFNSVGLSMSTNLVPDEKGNNNTVMPSGNVEKTVCTTMLVRYVLDNFATVNDAITYLSQHVKLYHPGALLNAGYNMHFILKDATTTKVIEFIEGELVALDADYMTNFHLEGVTLNSNGTVYTPGSMDTTHDAITTNHIEEHGSGLERYNIIAGSYNGLTDRTSVRNLLNNLKFTKAYLPQTDPYWYTEFAGDSLKVNSPVGNFSNVVATAQQAYENRSRADDLTWQTVHAAIYDFAEKKLYCIFQEGNVEHEFKLTDGSEGTRDYDELIDKPQINGVELSGNKTSQDLKIAFEMEPGWTTVDGVYVPDLDSNEMSEIWQHFNLGECVGLHGQDRAAAVVNSSSDANGTTLVCHIEENTVIYRYPKSPEEYVVDIQVVKPSAGGVVITPSAMTQVGGYDVPDLTVYQVTALYNALVAGRSCTVTNDIGDVQFRIMMGDASTGRPSILLKYYWLADVDYQVTAQDTIAITVHKHYTPTHEITSVTVGTDTIDITIT